MKLLLDHGLPRTTVKHLAAAGIVAEHVADLGMSDVDDDAILAAAAQRNAVVVTFDADFHQLLAVSGATSPSVIRIRIERLKGDQVAAILVQVISTTSAELSAGAVVSVTPRRIRVRALPIG
jgi:predicted nuclease of predicted toxin-antitoxin system